MAMLTAGCVARTLEPVLVREPRPALIPLVIGVYYPEELRSFIYRFPSSGQVLSDEWMTSQRRPVAVGEASVTLLDRALALMFKEVVRAVAPPPHSGDRIDVAGVIEPKVPSVSCYVPAWGKPIHPLISVKITYGFTLYSPTGKEVASWSVTGDVTTPYSVYDRSIEEGFERAMRLAAWEFASGFPSVPEVRRWLDAGGIE